MWFVDKKIQYSKHVEHLRQQLTRLIQQIQNGSPLTLPKSGTEITYDNCVPHSCTQMWQPNYQLKKPIQNESLADESNLTRNILVQQKDANLAPKICLQKNHANSIGKSFSPKSLDKLSTKNSKQTLPPNWTRIIPCQPETQFLVKPISFVKNQYRSINDAPSLSRPGI